MIPLCVAVDGATLPNDSLRKSCFSVLPPLCVNRRQDSELDEPGNRSIAR